MKSVAVGVVAVGATVASITFGVGAFHIDARWLIGAYPLTSLLLMTLTFGLAFLWQFRRGRN